MKSLWYILAFGLSVSLHASLLLLEGSIDQVTIPTDQGHATLAIKLVSFDSTPTKIAVIDPPVTEPQPIEVEPQIVEPEPIPELIVEPVALALPVVKQMISDLPAIQKIVAPIQPQTEVKKPTPKPVEQKLIEPTPKAEVAPMLSPLPTPASVEQNADPLPQGVITQAKASDPIRPIYPMFSRRRGHEGAVLIKVQIFASGKTPVIVIAKPSGHRSLDTAALKACRKVRYQPALQNGMPIDSIFKFEVVFALQD